MRASVQRNAWALLPEEWGEVCCSAGQHSFRASQIVSGLYHNFASTWGEVSTLPLELRERLAHSFPLAPLSIREIRSTDDGVRKLLLACADGELVESVLIPSKERVTQCLSSQIGCAFGCKFCASGTRGLVRSLTADEIVGQVMAACTLMRETVASQPALDNAPAKSVLPRPDNLVVMGMGEPFDNYTQVMRALRILNHQQGLNIGARHITLSTCGHVPGIRRLAGEGVQFKLSVSLHAAENTLRQALMPVNLRWPIEEVLAACREYTQRTKRLVTYEYTLVRGVNDQVAHVRALIALLGEMPCKVNLIPLSPVDGFPGKTPDRAQCLFFLDALLKAGITTTLRKSRGKGVDAACGQLRLQTMEG